MGSNKHLTGYVKRLRLPSAIMWGLIPICMMLYVHQSAQAASRPVFSPSHPALELQTVNGISLFDNQAQVILKYGKPESILKDKWTPELEIYQYSLMKIAFSNGIVYYVEIPAAAKTIRIDQTEIPLQVAELKKALGKPDFVAQDGITFRRGQSLLKLYLDRGQLTMVHYFFSTNS